MSVTRSDVEARMSGARSPLLSASDKKLSMESYTCWLEDSAQRIILRSTRKQKILSAIGISFGAISALLSARIAWEFGIRIGMKSPYTYIAGSVFSICTGVTNGMGMVTLSERMFRSLATHSVTSQQNIVRYDPSTIIMSAIKVGSFSTIAVTSSVFTAYLIADRFSGVVKKAVVFLVIPTFLANIAVNYWSIDNGVNLLYTTIRYKIGLYLSNRRIEMEHYLDLALRSILSNINKLSPTELDNLYENIFTPNGSRRNEYDKLDRLSTLIPKVPQQSTSTGRKITGFIGACIGAISPYFVLIVTEKASDWLCNMLGIENESARENISKTLGWTSYAALGALSAYTTKIQFENIYDTVAKNVSNSRNKSVLETIGKSVVSAMTTTYRLEVSLQYLQSSDAWKVLVAICSVIGPFTTYYWGIDITKDRLKAHNKSARIESLIQEMIQILPKIQDKILQSLYVHIKSISQQAMLSSPNSPQTPTPSLSFSQTAANLIKSPVRGSLENIANVSESAVPANVVSSLQTRSNP